MTSVYNVKGERVDFEAAVILMDDEVREEVHAAVEGDCPAQNFFEFYATAHEKRFGEPFAPWAGLAW